MQKNAVSASERKRGRVNITDRSSGQLYPWVHTHGTTEISYRNRFTPPRQRHYPGLAKEQHHGIPVVHGKKFDSKDDERPGELQYSTGAL